MLTNEIRKKFLDYFREKGHAIVPSSPVVPHEDPTLLFINAGMNQFKDVFLGTSVRDYNKAATSQKCIRVGGKHNDLENVGHTRRHLTFFEMLGNFSFGDYFKQDAIRFAWEVSTEVFGFEPERIWPTVFREDDEAFEIWAQFVPAARITRFGEKQNFWAMGDTGPCGPCSELLYDRGEKYGSANNPQEDIKEERYLEFWNLVFMQYNRDESGARHLLPKPSIDTGAGLERVVNLKMGVDSVFETDVLGALIGKVEEISGVNYSASGEKEQAAFRVIADHLRCLSFAIADGAQPSNIDRGYVLRKVLRRAVRYGRLIGITHPFLGKAVPKLIDLMGGTYSELAKAKSRIEEILYVEEEAFFRTLQRGGNILNQVIEEALEEKRAITGQEAFKLKDTYGFPLEEILLLARDANLAVDAEAFADLEQEARERSRSAQKTAKHTASVSLFENFFNSYGACEFVGYQELGSYAKVTAIVADDEFVDELLPGKEALVILDRTPFYAEKGGQVGDQGQLIGEGVLFLVTDAQSPYKGIIGHVGKVHKGTLKVGDSLFAQVDSERRQKIANNHTATHLLHLALCQVLGEHVKQAGSLVAPDRFRFDFSHHKAVSREEIEQVEDLINEKIRENKPVEAYEIPYEKAIVREDIKQFFGEKYDSVVRVIDIDVSKELCGGTHTSHTGNIGYFRIVEERSIAAGIRRIEAITGKEAEVFSRQADELVGALCETVGAPAKQQLIPRLEKLLQENSALSAEVKKLKKRQLVEKATLLLENKELVNGIPFLAHEEALSPDELKDLADEVMQKTKSLLLVLGSSFEGKCQLQVRASDDLVNQGLNAKTIVAAIAPIVGGGGGGKAAQASAGGKYPEKLGEALKIVKELLNPS